MTTRRGALRHLAAGMVAPVAIMPARAQDVSLDDLAAAGPLGDVVLGSPVAKVTVVEYASLTCGHCAAFHKETYPDLKRRFIDTGKVRFILREFPLDPLATGGFMLARCEGNERYYPVTDLLFERQRAWAYADQPLDALQLLMRQAGFSKEKFEACLKDQKLYDAVNTVKQHASDKLKISSTPTFFINGQRHVGSLSIAEMEKIITRLLGP